MLTYYRYKNENMGYEFTKIPSAYRDQLRKIYLSEVASEQMTVERYEELTGEQYPITE